jgi:hypothetical protein
MSNNKDHNQKLKNLLNKNSTEMPDNTDEFEKAALEGFALLESEQEVLDLKDSLDLKIYAEVFKAKKQESRTRYWLAAAALIGVTGFSIYFFQSSFEVKNDGLAIQQPTVSGKHKIPEDSELSHDKKVLNEALEAQPSKEAKTIESKKTIKSLHIDGEDTFKETQKKDNTELINSAASNTPSMVSEKREGDEKTVKPQEEIVLQQANEDLPTPPRAQVSRSSVNETENVKQKKFSKKEERNESTPSASQLGDVVTISTGSMPFCYYDGGDSALKKDLNELLLKENLLFKFDALLFLNKKARIEKVTLINTYGLKNTEQTQLTELLKTLSKFRVKGEISKKERLEYKIEFRP